MPAWAKTTQIEGESYQSYSSVAAGENVIRCARGNGGLSVKFALLLAVLSLLAAPLCAGQPQSARPNILWISAEDLSPDLGCYGDAYARTPNLDRFAAQGTRFTNAFATSPVCAPSRSAIITGMYPTSIGTMHMRSQSVPPPQVKCFPEYLRAAGYYCTNNAKTDYNFPAPVTAWDENSGRAHWRNRPDKNQPFFAVFNLGVTHESQIRAGEEAYQRNTAALTEGERHDPAKATLPPYYPDTPLVRKDWARYHDNITAMDRQVAALLKQLDEDGLTQNTVVFFWGDHGRGLPRAKRWVYDSGLRVPLLVRWPGKIRPGTVNDNLISLFDLAPTVLSIAGVKPPAHMQARACLGAHAAAPRDSVFAHRDRMDETYDWIRAVRDRRFKYIKNFEPGKPYAQFIGYGELMPTMMEMRRLHKDEAALIGQGKLPELLTPPQRLFFRPEKPAEELYDTLADLHEIHNLASDLKHGGTLTKMRRALAQWEKETNDLGAVPEADLIARWRPGGVWPVTAAPVAKREKGQLTLSCPAEGASLAYTTDMGEGPRRWRLYTAPVAVPPGAIVRARACRLGFRDSADILVVEK